MNAKLLRCALFFSMAAAVISVQGCVSVKRPVETSLRYFIVSERQDAFDQLCGGIVVNISRNRAEVDFELDDAKIRGAEKNGRLIRVFYEKGATSLTAVSASAVRTRGEAATEPDLFRFDHYIEGVMEGTGRIRVLFDLVDGLTYMPGSVSPGDRVDVVYSQGLNKPPLARRIMKRRNGEGGTAEMRDIRGSFGRNWLEMGRRLWVRIAHSNSRFDWEAQEMTRYFESVVEATARERNISREQVLEALDKREYFKEQETVRIGCSSLTPLHCMFGEIFSRTDILEKNGLKGEIAFFEHGKDQSEACKAGAVDVTFSCEVPAITQLNNCPGLVIVGTPGSLGRIALVVPRRSPLLSPGDLKGRTILIHEGASATMVTRSWLAACGVDPDREVTIKYADKDSILDRLSRGEADAIVEWDPWLEDILRKQPLRIVNARPFRSVIVVTREYLRRFPGRIARYQAALKDAFAWASRNRETAAGWVAGRSGIKRDVVENVLGLNRYWKAPSGASLVLTQDDQRLLAECNDYAVRAGLVPADFDVRTRIDAEAFSE